MNILLWSLWTILFLPFVLMALIFGLLTLLFGALAGTADFLLWYAERSWDVHGRGRTDLPDGERELH